MFIAKLKIPSPLEAAIKLGLKTEEAIRYHQEYIMLLGLTEFTKIYIQIKDNPWPYVNLARLVHNARVGDGEIVELLKIANGYLPRQMDNAVIHKASIFTTVLDKA